MRNGGPPAKTSQVAPAWKFMKYEIWWGTLVETSIPPEQEDPLGPHQDASSDAPWIQEVKNVDSQSGRMSKNKWRIFLKHDQQIFSSFLAHTRCNVLQASFAALRMTLLGARWQCLPSWGPRKQPPKAKSASAQLKSPHLQKYSIIINPPLCWFCWKVNGCER